LAGASITATAESLTTAALGVFAATGFSLTDAFGVATAVFEAAGLEFAVALMVFFVICFCKGVLSVY